MDSVERREALRRMKISVDSALAGADRARSQAEFDTHLAAYQAAMVEAIQAGIPVRVAMQECFGRECVADVMEVMQATVANLRRAEGEASRAKSADAHVSDRPAIPLPERFPDPNEVIADADTTGVRPTMPDRLPDAAASEADVRSIREAEAALGATLTEAERRIAADAVNQLRIRASRATERATRLRPSLCGGRSLRRVRASRAPRRAAHRSAVAPSRDGPPSDAPAPVGSRSPHGAVGGSR
jgi:hypothetical protein